jgi:hypothetical protein
LRAAIEQAPELLVPGGAYLFGAGPEVLTMPFQSLARAVRELLVIVGEQK